MNPRLKRALIVGAIVLPLVVIWLLFLALFAPAAIEMPIVTAVPLVSGWLALPLRTIPQMRWEPMMLASALVYAGAFVGGLHVLMGRLTGRRSWRVTCPVAALPVLMFVSGSAAVAVVTECETLAGERSYRDILSNDTPAYFELFSGDRHQLARLPMQTAAGSEDHHRVVVFGPDGKVGAVATFDRDPRRRDEVRLKLVRGSDRSKVVTFEEFQRIRRDVEAGKLLEPGKLP